MQDIVNSRHSNYFFGEQSKVEGAKAVPAISRHAKYTLARLADDLPLFNAARRRAEPAARESAAEALLRDTRPDELTPREALDLLYRLRELAVE